MPIEIQSPSKTPLVSIVINNYNYGGYIATCVQSALRQDYRNVEVIVVDDGSDDSSRAVIQSLIGEIPSISVIYKQNGGQASAFNVGILKAKGEYVLLLDSDDYLHHAAVSTALEAFDSTLSRVSFGLDKVDAYNTPIGKYHLTGPSSFSGSLIEAVVDYNFFPGTPTSGNLFRTSALRKCLPVPEEKYRISADLYLFCRSAAYGNIKQIPKQLGYYRVHEKNNFASSSGRLGLTKTQLKNQAENILNSYQLMMDAVAGNSFSVQRKVHRFILNLRSIELLSDLVPERVTLNHHEMLDRETLLNEAARAAVEGAEPPFRSLMGFLSVAVNILTPLQVSYKCKKAASWATAILKTGTRSS